MKLFALLGLVFLPHLAFAQVVGWQTERVGGAGSDVGEFTTMVVRDGTPIISFHDETVRGLRYARLITGAWQLNDAAVPGAGGHLGHRARLAVSPDRLFFTFLSGEAILSFRPIDNNGLVDAVTGFPSGLADISVSGQNDLAVGPAPDYRPQFVYRNVGAGCASVTQGGFLLHRWRMPDGTSWGCVNITTAGIAGPHSFVIRPDGVAAVTYSFLSGGNTVFRYRFSSAPDASGNYTWPGGNANSYNVVTGIGLAPSVDQDMALRSDNSPQMVHYDPNPANLNLVYVRRACTGGVCTLEASPIDEAGDVGRFPSIAVCPDDSLHVSYYDATNQSLKYARRGLNDTRWTILTLDDDATNNLGQHTSIACDSNNRIHISYYDATNKDLKYASNANVCGNGVVETAVNEQCDDGNIMAGDGCSATCQTESSCGNGTCESGETADDCPADCGGGGAVCGNSILETGEQCDDGDIESGDGCSSTCTNEVPPSCGDGIRQTGEACDDNNIVAGDGCSATCQTETPAGGAVCGNGTKETGEDCDDGNTNSGDGCSATCRTEAARVAVCGNSRIETGEDCDDGNTAAGDGCDATCKNEGRVVAPAVNPVVPVPTGKPTRGGGCTLIPLSK